MAAPLSRTPARFGAPAPLIAHLAAAAEIAESGARLAPLAGSPRFPWGERPGEEARALAEAVAAAPQLEMSLALRSAGAARLAEMARGLRRYQRSRVRRRLVEPPVFWRRGSARLLDYGEGGGAPVLVTPSLINDHRILDLDGPRGPGGGSLMRWLARRGLRPLLLDWGAPAAEELGFSLGDYVERRLIPAFDAAADALGPPALMGYCMGGTLTVALAARRRAPRLALIGAPWDFDGMAPMRGALAALGFAGERAALARAVDAVGSVFGAVPVSALQAVFAQLDPGLAARKFRRYAATPPRSIAARRFVLIEDWLNGGAPLAGPTAREALIDWHLDNATRRRRWRVAGDVVDPRAIAAPTLIVAATKDRIAPPAAAEPLAEDLAHARILRPEAGHVGMIVGADAVRRLWRPLADFLAGTSAKGE